MIAIHEGLPGWCKVWEAFMTKIAYLIALAIVFGACNIVASNAGARSRSSSDGQSSRANRADTFRTSPCKTASCWDKHPSGEWVHPITPRKH